MSTCFELEIETLTIGGRGLGRHLGKAIFVPHAAPGDLVRCRITHDRSQYAEAELCEVLRPSSQRRIPPCPVAGQCGGCQWQHLSYDEQLRWKERLFSEQMLRAGVATDEILRPIVGAPGEWNYRNRVQFKCRMTQDGFVAGFYRHASHFVVDSPGCMLAMPQINEVYAALRKSFSSAPRADTVPQVDISCSDDGNVAVLVHLLPAGRAEMLCWLEEFASSGDFSLAVQVGRKETIQSLVGNNGLETYVDHPPICLRISPGGFSQVNPDQNRKMIEAVKTAAALSGRERVLDLYCGVGNFTLPLARHAGSIVGVEDYAPAVSDAEGNASQNGIENASFYRESAADAIARHGSFDLVVLDPPRTGAYPVMRDLLALQPQRILYVSCDPATLARDLKPLVCNGYRTVSLQPFDFFPQTWHIESLTVLERYC